MIKSVRLIYRIFMECFIFYCVFFSLFLQDKCYEQRRCNKKYKNYLYISCMYFVMCWFATQILSIYNDLCWYGRLHCLYTCASGHWRQSWVMIVVVVVANVCFSRLLLWLVFLCRCLDWMEAKRKKRSISNDKILQ